MDIAIIGTGNVGGTLAKKWAMAGYNISLGVRDQYNFKGKELEDHPNINVMSVREATGKSEVILLATPAPLAIEVAKSLGDTSGKVIIDSMNVINGRGPEGYSNSADAILDNTSTKELAKCFNITGSQNLENPQYGNQALDMFTCGDSQKAKEIAVQLSQDAGFENCYDVGGNDKFEMMEQFAWFWINLAMVQGLGRDIGFKLLKR